MLFHTDLRNRLGALRAVAFDVDGTLTDGRVSWNAQDVLSESKAFHFADIMGISLLRRLGLHLALISGEPSPLVHRFAEKLHVPHVVTGCRDKASAVRSWSEQISVALTDTCFFGDDVNDLWAMEIVGLCACPADAATEVLSFVAAHPTGFIATKPGGAGAVRDFCDAALAVRGMQGKDVFRMSPPAP